MEINTSKQVVFEIILTILFFPLLAFDIFLFYDDGASDFALAGKLWLITFLMLSILYLYRQKKTGQQIQVRQITEMIPLSFIVLFFAVNFILIGLFLLIIHGSNQFLI